RQRRCMREIPPCVARGIEQERTARSVVPVELRRDLELRARARRNGKNFSGEREQIKSLSVGAFERDVRAAAEQGPGGDGLGLHAARPEDAEETTRRRSAAW